MKTWVVICWAAFALVGADECPDGGSCEEGQTCCSSPNNGYGCCPFDQAECCGDHVHCCPADTLCNPDTSSCVNATVSIPWQERTSALQPTLSKSFRMIKSYMGEDDDNICPDQSRCPAEFSCLKALTKFGCCPLAKGVSCSDGKHCCPEGHQCSLDSRSCIKKENVAAVLCSDGVSECPDETTCCETPEGKWGCCPMPKAVCCEDKEHCCPDGTTCDTEQMKCISISTKKVLPMWAKFPARLRADWENQKEDEKITAKGADGDETEKSTEVTTANPVPSLKEEVTQSSVAKADAANNVPCNETAACPDDSTCCKTKEGGWACCPLPEAVCCEDFIHCCPNGKTCNLAAQTCDDGLQSVPWVEKVPSFPRLGEQTRMENVTCDGTASCPDGTTCCKTKEGGWACCPLPEAVCCEDFIHCCPKGKKCNLAAQTCDDGLLSLPWVEKIPSIPRLEEKTLQKDVTCDATASCPDGTTCCKNKEGGWACCPLPKAVCCPDHEHCCPEGTTCDETSTSCLQASGSTPMFKKIPVFTTTAPTTVATTTECLVTSTPETNVEIPSQDDEEEGTEEDRNQCDEHTSCPLETTCCFMAASKKWGCCPLPKAVCCTDGSHCCPEGYKCNEEENTCLQGEVQIPWYTKIPAISRVQADDSNMRCDDDHHCPEHTSCCMLFTGEWGCCPLQNAVCCSDKEHCCPQGYSCDVLSKTCQKAIMLQLETLPLTPVFLPEYHLQLTPLKHKDVPCDEQTSCPDNETCCRTSSTTWGCCPSPNAVCCSDMKHCCPQGSTCTDEGSCTQSSPLDWLNWNMFLANKKRALIL
ncbi:PREDICTED: granulins-like isoform X1 [Cyprinodon variegatus]|uniref:granulins-like isoform X1 n=1 Tax=Cyprinodon variegatus TaxID=28743 RepID=UPI00074289C0|nr:PREDICTED: granulins-like isoform X1 [Cyprinodon variegatus]